MICTALLFLGFCGSDFFTYRLQVSSMNSSIATVAITINDGNGDGKKKPTRIGLISPRVANQYGNDRHNANEKVGEEGTPTLFTDRDYL